jgi:hypothetical protein
LESGIFLLKIKLWFSKEAETNDTHYWHVSIGSAVSGNCGR